MTASLISSQIGLGWRFDPDEPRDARGRWTHSGAAYTAPDHARLISHAKNPNTYHDPADHPFFRKHPVSAANIVAAFSQASPEEMAQGMRWYADAHALAKAIGRGDAVKGAGLLAAYSPQSPWPASMFNAARSMELGRAIGPGEGMITRSMQRNAQEAMDGLSTEQNFGSGAPKIRAFARLIEHGGDHPDDTAGEVVLDRHAMSVAMNERLPKTEADHAPIGQERFYQHVADEYRKAALEITRRGTPAAPHQVQAVTWLRQQRRNAEEDLSGLREEEILHHGVGRGRQSMIRKSWDRWQGIAAGEGLPVVPGTTSLAGTISEQVIGLAWRDAWMHERRDSRGRWTRGDGGIAETGAGDLPRIRNQVMAAQDRADADGRMDMYSFLGNAVRLMDRMNQPEWPSKAANWIMMAADRARDYGDREQYGQLSALAHDTLMISSGQVAPDSPQDVTTRFMQDAGKSVPGLLGGGHLAWDGKPVTLYPAQDDPYTLAMIDWDGHVRMQREYAEGLAGTLKDPGRQVDNPDWFTVPLHELIHADIPDADRNRHANGDDTAYQAREYADIEEGFTELGAIQHAPEFMGKMGVGDRKVSRDIAIATMSEYARRLQDANRIKSGNAWGHYPDQAMWAEEWVEMIAQGEGHRSRNPKPGTPQWERQVELADEINRQGTKAKPDVMAAQLYGILMKEAAGRDDPQVKAEILGVARETILKSWAGGHDPVTEVVKEASARLGRRTAA